MNKRVAVVIPFFQRGSGIVEQAVDSILEQTYQDFEILVVDDRSPFPAADELKKQLAAHPDRIRIVMMERNSGQGAARNKGLDCVSPGVEYVAFLDSDDVWTQDHLRNAVDALDQGYDFYFSDFYQLNQSISAFNRAKRINPVEHKNLPASSHLHVYGDDMFTQIIAGNVLGMSTIVYRKAKFPDLRFRIDFRSTGEEYLFWLSLSRLTDRIVFSSAIECRYGAGVNTYSGATWGREGAIRRVHDEIRYLLAIPRDYDVTPAQERLVRRRVRTLRTEFVREILHRIARGRTIEPWLSWGVLKMDPACVPLFIPIALKVAAEFTRNRARGSAPG